MTRVAILGDTHVPSRARMIPGWIVAELEAADRVIHVGDFDSPRGYDRIEAVAGGELTAVRGNVDPTALGLPTVATLECEGVTFVVTHGTGSPSGWRDRVVETVLETAGAEAVGVAGHTHEVVDETVDGVRLLNPGSATGASPADRETMLVAEVAASELEMRLRAE